MLYELNELLARVSDLHELAGQEPSIDRDDDYAQTRRLLVEAADDLANAALSHTSNVQALALARLMRDRPNSGVYVARGRFDLPDGYWSVIFTNPAFECGIAPDGSVSS